MYGFHGASIALSRACLEEVLKRFPEWDIDLDKSKFMYYADMRGYESLPVTIP